MIIGSGSASFEILRYLVERLPVMITPALGGRTESQPIAVRNVLHYLVDCLDVPETAGRDPRHRRAGRRSRTASSCGSWPQELGLRRRYRDSGAGADAAASARCGSTS